MGRFRVFLGTCYFAIIMASSGFGQTVVAIGGPAKEMKRTAHQLRISVNRLRNAREALQEATDRARRSTDSTVFAQVSP